MTKLFKSCNMKIAFHTRSTVEKHLCLKDQSVMNMIKVAFTKINVKIVTDTT